MASTPEANEPARADHPNVNRVSSPVATGGAGTFFEQHVAAYWLAQLLVRGVAPIAIDSVVTEVHLQTEHLGRQTDDFLIICERPGAAAKKLVGQVKRRFTVSAANDDCRQTIRGFWADFKNRDRFSPTEDSLVLVTQRGTETLLNHFVGLLDCARAARDSGDFDHRLSTEGFLAAKVVEYCDDLQKIVAEVEGQSVSRAEIWPFLRVLHVLSLDLDTSTRQHEALVKNLLTHTETGCGGVASADASWNALLALASASMYAARSFHRSDLPQELLERHASIGAGEQRVLRALDAHAKFITARIRSTIGSEFHFRRDAVVQQVLEMLERTQVVLVSGPAGCGKSAIMKDAITILMQNYVVAGFRAVEFARPHFDETLHAGQIPANGAALSAILAGQGRKIIFVESVERLLEKTTRDAFSDLMTLADSDRSMRFLLTCRDYSVELVRSTFLRPHGIGHDIVNVPPLNDEELREVEKGLPTLGYPLKNAAFRNILRNPYFLDKAAEIPWSAEGPVPQSEREFRALCWRAIVRAEDRVTAATARSREEVFQAIAVRRARELSPYVLSNDLDQDTIASLRQDSLISSAEESTLLVATAHDVLEDWAVLHWLGEENLITEESFKGLSAAIGGYPAIRRSYRKWIAELLERDAGAADRLFEAAITEPEISAQFRDDTLVSLLKASSSPEFLLRHEAQLVANNRTLLKRAIHLLRVACVTTPAWLGGSRGQGSIFNVPDGPAWAPILSLVHRNIGRFAPEERSLLLGLIEDAVRNVSWWTPEVAGAESVAGIGHSLLEGFDNYASEKPRKRVLKVIAKVPKADPTRFESILRGHKGPGEPRDHVADDFREIIFSGLDGMAAARDLPDLIVSVAADYLLASEGDLRRDRYESSPIGPEIYFGIKEKLRHDFFPPSAIRGPWIHLLRYHPLQAVDFFIRVFNHSVQWYAHPRSAGSIGRAWEVELTFADGTTKKQWGDVRLWNLYRGTQGGPYVLECMLMALEKWLFEVAAQAPQVLDGLLVDILRRSESAALSAVVASISTGQPRAATEALLVLLSAPDYVMLDKSRMVVEPQALAMAEMLPSLRAEERIYDDERKEANRLPSRRRDLETAITELQLGPSAARVQAILDKHLAALPPPSEQDEAHLTWRLAIHRMDLRQYVASDAGEHEFVGTIGKAEKPAKGAVWLDPKALDPDTQAKVDENMALYGAMNARLGVLMWGVQVFRHDSGTHDPSQWKGKLAEARLINREADQPDGSQHGPGFVAAVCVRDHWDDMSDEERDWCVDTVVSEVLRHSHQWSPQERVQRNSLAADRPCAAVVSRLLGRSLSDDRRAQVRQAFATAHMHPIEEVRLFAASGIDQQFWAADRTTAMRCVNAIATEAARKEALWQEEMKLPYESRCELAKISAEAATTTRRGFWEESEIRENAYELVDLSTRFGAKAAQRMLTILGQVPEHPETVYTFARATRVLVSLWDAGDDPDQRHARDIEAEMGISNQLPQFLMKTAAASAKEVLAPLLDAVDRHSREVYPILQGLTTIEDASPNTSHYWYLWSLFADGIKRVNWLRQLGDEHPEGSEMLSAIFLTSWWKENVRHWRSLEGFGNLIDDLFVSLPPSWIVLDSYVRFLYHIGERSLPAAFPRVAASLKRGEAQAMLRDQNTVFMLEILLQRHVYGRPLELKQDRALREAVLFLLDILVENGSSAAFRMRDDFVTPVSQS